MMPAGHLALAVMLPAALALAACSSPPASPLPDPPATLAPVDDYPWGDAVAQADGRLARHVTDQFGASFGRARETHYVAPSATVFPDLRDWYGRTLGTGWHPARVATSPGEAAFAFTRDRQALVIAWLPAQPDGRVPVTAFAFGMPD